jgi:para-aminobenzoate synthetase component I
VIDHQERKAWLASGDASEQLRSRWDDLKDRLCTTGSSRVTVPFHLLSKIASNLEEPEYARRFARLRRYIADGDCYQVNLTRRFSARAAGDPWTAYLDLRRFNPAPMSAYMQLPFAQILSSSPERFLELRNGRVEAKPIKGTRPRKADPQADRAEAFALFRSAKDRAENVMIVDLLRNDLGKVCATGSVAVPRLFQIESFATVHHLVSTVTGMLDPEHDAVDLLQAAFPGGSITGAPKLRAMQIIEELEPHRRGVYCGAIGYLGFDGAMDLNIAIRTLVYADGVIRFWAGGGIVADSEVRSEFQETLDKAAAILSLLAQGPRLAAGGQ